MQSIKNVKKCVAGVLLCAAFIPRLTNAALGEAEASVQSDMTQLRASLKVARRTNYTVHEMQLPSGTVMREFSGADGRVFAVAWSGRAMPNLRQTLGQYFDSYLGAAQANHGGHHQLQIDRSDLVVHASGHMRAFSGVAYLPAALPAGVTLSELH